MWYRFNFLPSSLFFKGLILKNLLIKPLVFPGFEPVINRLVAGTKKQSKGKSVTKIANIRDEYLVELQKLRKKYEKKLR